MSAFIRSAAPIRICDLGGWTDTWFAAHGCVFNLAAHPAVDVELRVSPADVAASGGRRLVVVHAENFGRRYVRDLDRPEWTKHPLIEAALETLPRREDLAYRVNVFSAAPLGASMGASSATAVALLAAIRHLKQSQPSADTAAWSHEVPETLAREAHLLETERLEQQAGVQDQLCAAFGGACFIEIDKYPHARVTRLPLPDPLRWELDARLAVVYLGRTHKSSKMHECVIRDLADRGPDAPPLQALRRAATAGRDAFVAGDLRAFGAAMQANTEAQAALHAGLIGADAQRVIDIARKHEALGWKVNGAGGDGGSLTILCDASLWKRREMVRAIETENTAFRVIPIRLSVEGVRVWQAL